MVRSVRLFIHYFENACSSEIVMIQTNVFFTVISFVCFFDRGLKPHSQLVKPTRLDVQEVKRPI